MWQWLIRGMCHPGGLEKRNQWECFGLEIGYSGMLDTTRVRRVVGPGLCPTVRGTATVCNGSSESSAKGLFIPCQDLHVLVLAHEQQDQDVVVPKKAIFWDTHCKYCSASLTIFRPKLVEYIFLLQAWGSQNFTWWFWVTFVEKEVRETDIRIESEKGNNCSRQWL